jgi:hypothetical protein
MADKRKCAKRTLSEWRNDAFFDEAVPNSNGGGVIDTEDRDGHSPNGSAADQDQSIPVKAPLPVMASRVEQLDERSG